MGCLKSELGCERVRRYRVSRMRCSASVSEWCIADPGPPRTRSVTVPGLQRTTSCCAVPGTRERGAFWRNEPVPKKNWRSSGGLRRSCKKPTHGCAYGARAMTKPAGAGEAAAARSINAARASRRRVGHGCTRSSRRCGKGNRRPRRSRPPISPRWAMGSEGLSDGRTARFGRRSSGCSSETAAGHAPIWCPRSRYRLAIHRVGRVALAPHRAQRRRENLRRRDAAPRCVGLFDIVR